MKNFKKFRSIENFVSLHQKVKKDIFVNDRPTITYRGKVKLHGTNAGVTIRNREMDDKAPFYVAELAITPLKRTSFISPQDDNYDFAKWVGDNLDFFADIFCHLAPPAVDVTVFGEWAGKGIQKSDAISKIENKSFFIFSIRVDDEFIVDPIDLCSVCTSKGLKIPPHAYILPWATPELKVNFSTAISVHEFIDEVNLIIEPLTQIDPYVRDFFDIEDSGEGMVFYPLSTSCFISDKMFDFVFKAKVEAHRMSGNKNKAAEADPILHDNAEKFAREYVTDARLAQALSEVYPGRDMSEASRKDTGPILAWICRDVMNESEATLEASGMTWKQVAKAVTSQASHKYSQFLESL